MAIPRIRFPAAIADGGRGRICDQVRIGGFPASPGQQLAGRDKLGSLVPGTKA
jgi:hypothetical protein